MLRPQYIQVLIAVCLAVVLGLMCPEAAGRMKPLGDGFVALLKILIGPIIFCTVVLGLSQVRDLKRLGRVAAKSFIYYEVVSTIALACGMIAANVFLPGLGATDAAVMGAAEAESVNGLEGDMSTTRGFVEVLMSLIPHTFLSAFADGEILQVLLLACLSGSVMVLLGDRASRLVELLEQLQAVFLKMLGLIIRLSPLGAFGATAYTVGTHGSDMLFGLAKLIVVMYGTCIFFVFVVLGCVAAAFKLSILSILRLIKEEIFIVLGTSSSVVALPRLITKLEQAGCEKSIVGLVLSTGYSFNTDGTSIYLSLAVIFIAQATSTPLSVTQQLGILSILLLTSKGGAAISGAGFVKLVSSMQAVKILPMSGLGVLVGIDRFMSEARSVTNMIGNTVATLVISRWEGGFDEAKYEEFRRNPRSLDKDRGSPAPSTDDAEQNG